MQANLEGRRKARELRSTGLSVGNIAQILGISKGSISPWVADIILTDEQQRILAAHSADACTQGRSKGISTNIRNRKLRWQQAHQEAEIEWPRRSKDPDFMFGLALYVGEGGKTLPYSTRFSNADPAVICKELDFFLQIGISRDRIRALLHLQDENLRGAAEVFWRSKTGLPQEQFYQTIVAISSASKQKGRILPHGTLQLSVNDTHIRQKLEKWMHLALEN